MSTEETLESKATPEQQAAATKIGWKPPEQFKGEPNFFVDADVYLERAETILPFVREQNKRLAGDLTDLRTRLEGVVGENADLKHRLEDIDIQHSTRLAKEVKRARAEAQAELEVALEAGDHKATARLTREVAKLEAIEDEPAQEVKSPPQKVDPRDQEIITATQAWATDNDYDGWSVRDKATFRAIGDELRRSGNRNVGKAFLDDCLSHMDRERKQEPTQKVESSRSSGTPRGGKKSGYEALTKEERDICDSDERNFVGKGKKFETKEAYRTHWSKVYQEQT